MFRQFIISNAPRFRSIEDRRRSMKTAFTTAMVEDLMQNNFVMIQFTSKEGQYRQYDMTNKKACTEIRKKINQAMRDSCSVATDTDVVYYNPLPLSHVAGADVVHHPLPPLGIQPAEENVAVGLPFAEIQLNDVPAQDADVELQMLGVEDLPNDFLDEILELILDDKSSDLPTSNDEREEHDNWSMQMSFFDDDNWSMQMSLFDDDNMDEDMDGDLIPGHELQNVFENPED